MNANDSDPSTLDPAAAELAGEPAKPPRRRAPRKPKAAPESMLLANDTALAEPAPRVEGDEPMPAPPAALPAPVSAVADAPGAEPGEAPSLPDEPSAGPREGGRRGRNRRRGRRGADGAREAARPGGEPANGEATGEGVDPEPVPILRAEAGEVFAQVLSGDFDIEPEGAADADPAEAAEPAKRVLAPDPDAPKLHKVLAQSGIGSRRDMEQLIEEGRITVNGEPAHVGQRISFGDQLRIDGRPIKARIAPPPPRVLAYHKPVGEVVTHDDPQHRPTVFRKLPRLAQGKWQSVGRLDINTEGLLLFTNSGELANQLMHPRFGVEREYAVRVLGAIDDEARARLLEGVAIDGQPCAFKSVEDGGGEGANRWYRVVITEGRNREVRKLFEAVGHAVSRLIRIRYGSVVLPRGLRRGVWVDLAEVDVWTLRRMTRPGPGAQTERVNKERRGKRRKRGADRAQPRDDVAAQTQRPPRGERVERVERGEDGPIPNPLQQTYDKRAFQQARSQRREISEDGPIPNPLQQTYDKRALQQERSQQHDYVDGDEGNDNNDGPIPNPLQQTYDRRFANGSKGALGIGRGAGKRRRGGSPAGAASQPDPMQTAVGYIGADAFARRDANRSRGKGRANPGRGGGAGGGGNRGGSKRGGAGGRGR